MKIKINYIDHNIILSDSIVNILEIENKKYFYRLINDLYSLSNGEVVEEIICINDDNSEIFMNNKIKIFTNYFEFDFDSKKYSSDISKYVIQGIEDIDKDKILNSYKKLTKDVNKQLNKLELPLHISLEQTIEIIIKTLKISITSNSELLDNLLLILDIEKVLKINKLLIFVNLKQYLTRDELNELYKYSVYNKVHIILIDSFSYGVKQNYETKLIIDNSLDEFVV